MTNYIAERTLISVTSEGEEKAIIIRLGQPYLHASDDWVCLLTLDGYPSLNGYPGSVDCHGGDSFQALILALSHAQRMLEFFIRQGGVLLDPHEKKPINLALMFSSGTF